MKKILLFAILIAFSGCATNTVNITDHFTPLRFVTGPLPKYEGMPHGDIYIMPSHDEFMKFIGNLINVGDSSDLQLGSLGPLYAEAPINPGVARLFTSECGGDKYIAAYRQLDAKNFVYMLWVRASPDRARELRSLGAISPTAIPPKSQSYKPQLPAKKGELLLNDSTL
jgi:hypothetical protein